MSSYVHGYSEIEAIRLGDQASTLSELLHSDTLFPDGADVLEAGCGVGAQTEIICRKNPGVQFHSVDISPESLNAAKLRCEKLSIQNVTFTEASIYDLPFSENSFDHIFLCFVLEHLPNVNKALSCLKKVLKPNGSLIVIEGDHGSAYFHPFGELAQKTIDCLVELQAAKMGDANIGRKLYPLLTQNGFRNVKISPRLVYVDNSLPHLVEGFTRNTFIAMVEGIEEEVLKSGMMSPAEWKTGISELKRSAGKDGVFNYCFFKGFATL